MAPVPDRPAVTVILPVRNEAACIGRALAAVLGQDYPKDRLEILVVDGMSTDGTRQVVERFVRRYSEVEPQRTQRQQRPDANSQPPLADQDSDVQPQRTQSIGESGAEPRFPPDSELSVRSVVDCPMSIRLLENPDRVAPCALNVGIRAARGDIVVRVDGHCEIASDYVRRCVEHILKDGVDGVGGSVDTVGETRTAEAIAAAMSSRFGVGDSAFRTEPGKTGLVDTVPFPAYTRSIIRQAGGYDEELVRCQDDEYNYRLLDLGARILLAGDVHSLYYSRGTLRSLWTQYFQYGYWKVRVMQKHPKQMRARQFVPPSFVLSLMIVLSLWSIVPGSWVGVAAVGGSYVVANLAASVMTASRKGWRYVLLLPVVYAILHLSYGLGFLVGLFKFWNRWGDRAGKVPRFDALQAR